MKKLGYIALVAFLALSFCFTLNEAMAQEKVLKFGAALSLTGGAARQGTRDKESYEFWQEVVNERGGINVAGTKYKVEITFYDDKTEASTSAKLVEKLITQDGVKFILGPYGSGASFAASSVGEKYKIPMMCFGISPAIYDRGYKYIFSVLKPGNTYTDAIYLFLKDMFKGKKDPKDIKVAIAVQNSQAMLPVGEHARDNAQKYGMQLAYYEQFASGTKDFTTILLGVKSKAPDFFYIPSYLQESIQVIKQMKDMNIVIPVVSVGFGQSNLDWRKSLGGGAYGVSGESEWVDTLKFRGPVFGTPQDFVELWKKKKGAEPDFENALGTAGAVVIQRAIEKAGTTDPKVVRDYISNFDEETFIGNIKFSPNGSRANPLILIQQVVSKDPEPIPPIVWPPEHATAKPIFPIPAWDQR